MIWCFFASKASLQGTTRVIDRSTIGNFVIFQLQLSRDLISVQNYAVYYKDCSKSVYEGSSTKTVPTVLGEESKYYDNTTTF